MSRFCVALLSVFSIHGLGASWAERTLQEMTREEKIGQLFLIAAYVDPEFAAKEIGNSQIIEEIDGYIAQYGVGGLAFVGPSEYARQVALTNHYQEVSKYPLLIAQDLEWGLSMRIKEAMCFPKNITLGAVEDNQLIYEMGKEVGRQAQLIGVHMNLSPVLDINTEPENVAINVRSFGDFPERVAEKGVAMIHGLQDAGIIASAKHFPGLGDITVDPHLGLPYSPHDKKRLYEVELYPFIQAIRAGVLSIQTEHLVVPALDCDAPASLSPKIVQGLLKGELGFKGLVLSGALRMKALTNHMSDEEIVLKAFLAGSDMLLMPRDFPKAYQALQKALSEGTISEGDVDERVLKILQMKERVKLDSQRIVAMPSWEQLHSPSAQALKKRLYESASTVVRDGQKLLPLSRFETSSIAYIQLGEAPTPSPFLNRLGPCDSFIFSRGGDQEEALFQKIDGYSLILLAVYPADPRRIAQIRLLNEKNLQEELKDFRVHGLSSSLIRLADRLQPYNEKTVVAFFGNPYGLPFFESYSTLIMAYEPDPDAQRAAADLLFGISEEASPPRQPKAKGGEE